MPTRTRTPSARKVQRVAVYARLSLTTEESVSIERQLDAARKYAAAREWEIVLESVDDGVSATKKRPEDRLGWRTILDSSERFEAVIIWKVDRLARRVLDFLHADEALQERGAGLVAVEDPVDMTTPQGRAFATMLAVFGEMEGAAISARVVAARQTIVRSGRRIGGRPPYGWTNVPNPNGPGLVLAKDPERIAVVTELAERALAGASVHSLVRWLEVEGIAPRPREGRGDDTYWRKNSVEAILRNPVLAGLTPFQGDVLRDADGLPVVDESVAIMSTADRRRLLAALDARKRPGANAGQGTKPSLLAGLVRCESCGRPMHRSSTKKAVQYRCAYRACPRPTAVSRTALEAMVEERFLRAVGRFPVVRVEEVPVDEAPRLAEVEAAIADTLSAMGRDDADVAALTERLVSLKALRTRAREDVIATPERIVTTMGQTFAEAWDALDDDVAGQRALLGYALDAVVVAPSDGRGPRLDPARVDLQFHEGPNLDALDGESLGFSDWEATTA